jgi:coenzyme PQQ precursor peptide PqqA
MKTSSTDRRETPAPRRDAKTTPARAWKRPDFTEMSACAEIGAYIFTA